MRKTLKFHLTFWCGIFVENAVSAEFLTIRQKLCQTLAIPQNSHTKKLGEIIVLYAVVLKRT